MPILRPAVDSPEEIRALALCILRTPPDQIYEMAEKHPQGSEMRAIYLKFAALSAQVRRPMPT